MDSIIFPLKLFQSGRDLKELSHGLQRITAQFSFGTETLKVSNSLFKPREKFFPLLFGSLQ